MWGVGGGWSDDNMTLPMPGVVMASRRRHFAASEEKTLKRDRNIAVAQLNESDLLAVASLYTPLVLCHRGSVSWMASCRAKHLRIVRETSDGFRNLRENSGGEDWMVGFNWDRGSWWFESRVS